MFAFREVSGEGEWPNTSLNHDFSGVYLVLSPSGSALPVPVKKQTTKLISVHNIGCVLYVTIRSYFTLNIHYWFLFTSWIFEAEVLRRWPTRPTIPKPQFSTYTGMRLKKLLFLQSAPLIVTSPTGRAAAVYRCLCLLQVLKQTAYFFLFKVLNSAVSVILRVWILSGRNILLNYWMPM